MNSESGFSELPQFDLSAEEIQRLPLKFCLKNHAVVLDYVSEDQPVTVGMLHPEDDERVKKISEKLGAPIQTVQLNAYEIRRALSRGYDILLQDLEEVPELKLAHDRDIEFEESRLPSEILRDILSRAVRERASDIHIECYRNDVDLRFRREGILVQVKNPLSVDNVRKVISKLKVMAEMDITQHRRAQDGRFSASYQNEAGDTRLIDIRLSVVPGQYGEEAVMRILDRETFLFDTAHLGMSDFQEEIYEDLIDHPSGMVLAVGPTASGKTTTLYTAVSELANEQKKILTAEDPIEYEFDKVNQKQISTEMGFADYTRAFLRQNPDVMMVGEIRDEETAEIAVRAANTGHLVLSTLHTGNAIMTVSRLRSLGIDDDYLAEVLLGLISQRLVRTLCEGCKHPVDPDPVMLRRFYADSPEGPFYEGGGCEQCQGTGYRGRSGVFEILVVDEKMRQLIADGTSTETIRRHVEATGFRPIHSHALDKVKKGETSLNEVARVISPPVELREIAEDLT